MKTPFIKLFIHILFILPITFFPFIANAINSYGGAVDLTTSPSLINIQLNESRVRELCDVSTIANDIVIYLTKHLDVLASTSEDRLWVWWEENIDTVCDDIPTDTSEDLLVDNIVPPDSLIQDSTFIFPSDLEDIYFNEWTILNRLEACEDTFTKTSIKLCIGVDYYNDGTDDSLDGMIELTDTRFESVEYNAYVIFEVDIEFPPAPSSIDITALDGSLDITASTNESGSFVEDIAEWKLYQRVKPDTDDSDEVNCTEWSDITTISSSSTSITTNLIVDTAITYEFCATIVDEVGNEGLPSEIQSGTARDECGFIECYPGSFDDGYCGSFETTWQLILALIALFLLRQRKKCF